LEIRGKQRSRQILRTAIVALFAGLTGCALPASAPTQLELAANEGTSTLQYAMVNVDPWVASILSKQYTSFGPTFRGTRHKPRNTEPRPVGPSGKLCIPCSLPCSWTDCKNHVHIPNGKAALFDLDLVAQTPWPAVLELNRPS